MTLALPTGGRASGWSQNLTGPTAYWLLRHGTWGIASARHQSIINYRFGRNIHFMNLCHCLPFIITGDDDDDDGDAMMTTMMMMIIIIMPW